MAAEALGKAVRRQGAALRASISGTGGSVAAVMGWADLHGILAAALKRGGACPAPTSGGWAGRVCVSSGAKPPG